MSLVDVLKQLQEKNIQISLLDDQLQINAAKGAMNKDLMQLLKTHKDELLVWAKAQQEKSLSQQSIPQRDNDLPLKLSYSQQRLWFIEQLAPGNATYNVPAAIVIKGRLDIAVLQQVMNFLMQRHEALRTAFIDVDGEARQVIHEHLEVDLECEEIDVSLDDQQPLLALAKLELSKAFDLSSAPLFRIRVLSLKNERQPTFLLLLNLHHIITDGWSNAILLKEIAETYAAFQQGKQPQLDEVRLQYADYAQWQQANVSVEQLQTKVQWWQQQLSGVPVLELPLDQSRPAEKSGAGDLLKFKASASVAEAIRALAKQQGCTSFIVLLAAYQLLLSRLSGQSDICIGTPSANRQRAEVQNTLGFFVNTLSLRCDIANVEGFPELLKLANKTFMDADEHQDVPFETIVESLSIPREMSSTPIFQTMISYQKEAAEKSFSLPGLSLEPLEFDTNTAKFDLTLGVIESADGLDLSFEYDVDIFKVDSVQRFADAYLQLLSNIIIKPYSSLNNYSILSDEECEKLLQWGQGQVSSALQQQHLAYQVRQWAEKTPDAIALEFGSLKISYAELDQYSNQYAHALQQQGFEENDFLALTLKRSPEMVVASLAALKLGGAYLPIDPDYPDDRIAYMLEDSAAKIVLCEILQEPRLQALMPSSSSSLVTIDVIQENARLSSSDWQLVPDNNQGQDIAYVMYTSGSTGQPKAVMVPQSGVSRLAVNTNMCVTTEDSRIAHLSNVAFDAAALEIWTALLNGACLVGIEQDDLLDADRFAKAVIEKEISFLLLTVALFNVYVSENPAIFSTVDYVFAGGEAVDLHKINAVLTAQDEQGKSAAPKHLINAYGPTENSCISSFYLIEEPHSNIVPIGKPLSNSLCYIVDAEMRLCPIGVSGELCVAGDGVALGYWNKEEQTKAAFMDNPFATGRLYKTGDVCRWNNRGQIEILGRVDEQVKIRGFRIELDEVSKQMGLLKGVSEAAVIIKEQAGNKYLAAYLVCADKKLVDAEASEESQQLFIQTIKTELTKQLPHYMLPQAFELMPSLPINANGKLNKKALPEPSFSLRSDQEYMAPRNVIEEHIVEIWASVLDLEKIGVVDNFFEIGGHSLLATRVMARIRQHFNVELALRDLFDNPTIAELSLCVQMQQGQKSLPALKAVASKDRPTHIPLSFSQQRLWFIEQMHPHTSLYHMPFALRLQGGVNVEALQQAFVQLVARHEILRTRIDSEKGKAWQIVDDNPDAICAFYMIDDDEQELLNRANQFLTKPFSFSKEHLLRAELLQQRQTGDFILLVLMHHIVSDAWSMDIFIRDLMTLYQINSLSLDHQEASALPALEAQYADYAIWQRENLAGDVLENQLAYWKQQLAYTEVLELPLDYSRPALLDNRGQQFTFTLPLGLSQQLRQLSQDQGSSLYMTLLAAWQILLARYSRQTDISVGTPIANRPTAELENMMGLFLNTLVMRSHVDADCCFDAFLAQVKSTTLDAYQHQDVPFELLVDELNVLRDSSQTPLFQVMFILQSSSQSNHLSAITDIDGIQISSLTDAAKEQTAKFDITLNIIDHAEQLSAAIEYRSALFSPDTIERLSQHFIHLLTSIVDDPQQKIAELDFISEAEVQQQMDFECGFNATKYDYPNYMALHHCIEEQVEQTPKTTAVVYEEQSLTYQQLNEQANQLAHYLIELGVETGDAVGLCLYRSEQMSIALLAILKAGAAYVPFDPDFPLSRLDFMAVDTQIEVLISDQMIPQTEELKVLHRLSMSNPVWREQSCQNVCLEVDEQALFNIIYTSGSTGKPKGVMVPHQGIINRLQWMQKCYPLTANDVVLQKTPYSFDVSVWELFWPLMVGSQLVFAKADGHKDPRYLSALIQQHQINTIHFVPSMLGVFLQTQGIENCRSLQQVFCSGEALQLEHVRQFYQRLPQAQLHNLYGPTEASIDVSFYHCQANETARSVPIGKAIDNTQLHILDEYLNIVPLGVAGDLYIGGKGLALGYLNREELTQSTFIENPFIDDFSHPSKKLYKTGDVARYLSDGNIEYLGRSDHQIKIRGLRIELGEIESRLQNITGIRECIVVAASPDGDNSNSQLLAYYISQPDQDDIAHNFFVDALKHELPEYMIPQQFICMQAWPLSANGKINRKALPQPQWQDASQPSVAASTDLQIALESIWLNLLPVEKIGIEDNFFSLGGHSLLATRLIAEVSSRFDIELNVADVFDSPTIELMANLIENTELHKKALPAIDVVARDQRLPLSFNQQRLWFLYKLQPSLASYNMPIALKLNGELNTQAFTKALCQIIERHEILRVYFSEEQDTVYQQVHEQLDVKAFLSLESFNSETDLQALMDEEARMPFDLLKQPMLRVRLFEHEQDDLQQILLITMHHIISDAVSLQNMVRELGAAYFSYHHQEPLQLPHLPIQYIDYAYWQQHQLKGHYLQQQLDYWQKQLHGAPALLNLPTDKTRPLEQTHNGFIYSAQLSDDTVKALRAFAQHHHFTPFMILLAAQQLLLGRLANEEDVCIGVPVAGRQQKGTENLLGFFVNALVIRSRFSDNPNSLDFIKQVKHNVLAAFAHQDAPFEQVIEQSQTSRSNAYTPIVQVGFNYITQQEDLLFGLNEQLDGLDIEVLHQQQTDAKYDMVWAFQDVLSQSDQGQIHLNLEFNQDLYALSTIQHWFELFEQLLQQLLNATQTPVLKVPLLSPENLCRHIQDQYPIDGAISSVRALTPMQRDLYLDTVFNVENRRNYFGWIHRIEHALDVELLQQAIDIITTHFSCLRMRIVESDLDYADLAYAAIIHPQHNTAKINLSLVDWSQEDLTKEEFYQRCKLEFAFKAYDLANEPLIRFFAVKEDDSNYAIVLTAHHSCIDGISLQTVTNAYTEVYQALLSDSSYSLVDDFYHDYVAEQYQQCDNHRSYTFWQEQSQNVDALSASVSGTSKNTSAQYIAEEVIDSVEHLAAIQAFCKNHDTSVFLYVKALYALMLQSYCNADASFYFTDIIAARPKGHIQQTGCYFEQRPTVIQEDAINSEKTFNQLLAYLNQQRLTLRGDYPISNSLQQRLFAQSDTQFIFNFYLTDRHLPFLDGQSETTIIVPEMDDAVNLTVVIDNERLVFNLCYTDNVFVNKQFIQRLLGLSKQVLAGVQRLSDLDVLLDAEKKSRVPEAKSIAYPHTSVAALLEAQLPLAADAIASVDQQGQLSFSQLHAKANQLANYLTQQGVEKGDRVALCLSANNAFLSALLACVKLGACYIPVDPNYPAARIHHMLSDSEATCALSHGCHESVFSEVAIEVLYLERLDDDIASQSETFLSPDIALDDVLYMIYTSGSTGTPKAAMVTQRGEINLLQWYVKEFAIDRHDNVLISSAIGFDLTQKNLLAPLLASASVIFPEMDDYDPLILQQCIKEQHVTLTNSAPSAFYPLVENSQSFADLSSLRLVLFGGEAIRMSELLTWLESDHCACQIVNMYGPTECTDIASFYRVTEPQRFLHEAMPIGQANDNVQLAIVDSNGRLLPRGFIGELVIGGEGVGAGYWNNEALTQKSFVQHSSLGRVYRSGDFVKQNDQDEFIFIRRKDHQVKVRGLRIELGEVESALKALNGIRDALVTVIDDKLHAYILAEKTPENWRLSLAESLADYMLPQYIIALDAWPLTSNGKIDRAALAKLDVENDQEFTAARNAIEAQLVSIWQDVLATSRISVFDNFFDLGGHSLLAAKAVTRIREQFQQELPLREVFLSPTIASIAELLAKNIQEDNHQSGSLLPAIEAANRDAYQGLYPLSFTQQRLWLIEQIQAPSSMYHMPLALHLSATFDRQALMQALQDLYQRHESLRTIIIEKEGSAYQSISHAPLEVDEKQQLPDQNLSALAASFFQQTFVLHDAPLFRVQLIETIDACALLLINSHHIISDGASNTQLLKDLAALYQAHSADEPSSLRPLTVQYVDYSLWQQKHFTDSVLEQQIEFWREQLHHSSVIDLPMDYARLPEQSTQGRLISFSLSSTLSERLLHLTQQYNTTLFNVLMAAYFVVLSRYSGQKDISIGTAVANRPQRCLEEMIGFFVNTLVIRNDFSDEDALSFKTLLTTMQQTTLSAFSHQDVPFERLLEELDVQRDLSHSPLFQCFFTLQNAEPMSGQNLSINGTEISAFDPGDENTQTTQAKFELSLSMLAVDNHISGTFEYRTALFDHQTIEALSCHFINLLEQISRDPTSDIYQLSMLTDEEQAALLDSTVVLHETTSVHADKIQEYNIQYRFEQQVDKHPDAVALSVAEQSISYAQLNLHVNRTVDYFNSTLLLEPASRIALLQQPSIDFIITLLAIVKHGSCYIPLDIKYPDERLQYILSDSAADAIVVDAEQQQRLQQWAIQPQAALIEVSHLASQRKDCASDNPVNRLRSDDALYIIYTSGSTGKPKGVEVLHQGENNLLAWYLDSFQFSVSDKVLIISALGFDLTQKNFFAPLCSGASIVFVEDSFYDPDKLRSVIAQQQISMINCAPSAFYPLIESAEYYADLLSLRTVLLGGEAIQMTWLKPWLEASHYQCELVNMYGPTECTDITTVYRVCSADDLSHATLPIGQAISGVQTLILDQQMQLLPPGAVGELYVSGIALAKGYVNQPEQNAAAYVNNPFGQGLLYKTGDLVRLLADGNISYVGRVDHQVKIRGLRIELAEIEKQLEALNGIEQALVMAKQSPSNEPQLVAYYRLQSDRDESLSSHDIRQQLTRVLADYMLPNFFISIEQWPLSANGKIDRKHLPEPIWKSHQRDDLVLPKNAIERRCLAIFLEVLDLEEVSVEDDFFRMGGHSLKAAKVVALLRKEFAIDISLRDMFEASRILDLALLVEQKQQQTMPIPPITIADREQPLALSYAQQRLWFLTQLDPSSPAYNMPAAFALKGQLNTHALENAFNAVLARHESLRSNIIKDMGEPKLHIHARKTLDLKPQIIKPSQLEQLLLEDAISAFNLEQDCLLRVQLLEQAEEDYVLLINMHHIISDGVSIQILLRELGTLYMAFDQGGSDPLPALKLQYTDYAQWQRQWLQGDVLDQQLDFWRRELLNAPTLLNLPLDYPRPKQQSFAGAVYKTLISDDLAHGLRQLSQDNSCTLFMTCLAAYQLLLAKYAQQDDICVGIPLAGRSMDGVEPMIGFFINALIIRSDFSANLSIRELLANVKASSLAAFAHEHVPIEMLLNELEIDRDLAYTPIAQCAFNMMSAGDDVLPPGLDDVLGDISIDLIENDSVVSKFDIQMNLLDIFEQGEQKLSLSVEFNTAIFKPSSIERMTDFYLHILQSFVDDSQQSLANIHLGEISPPASYEKVLPLTAMQRDIYLSSLADPDTLENTLGYSWDITTSIDVVLWQQALIDVANAFDVTKANVVKNNKPYQDIAFLAIKERSSIDFIYTDLSQDNLAELEMLSLLQRSVMRPIDLDQEMGIRYQLFKLTDDHYWASFSSHHLLMDGYAAVLHVAYLGARYEQLVSAKSHGVMAEAFTADDQFSQYCHENHRDFDQISTIEYWKKTLKNTAGLNATHRAIDHDKSEDILCDIHVPLEHYQAVKKYCRQFKINPPLYFKCIYALLVQHYTNAEGDFVLTEFNGGRNKFNKDSLGCFYHTQPFLMQADKLSGSVEELFSSTRAHQKASRKFLQMSNMKMRQLLPSSEVNFSYNYIMMSHQTSLFGKAMGGHRYTPNAKSMVDFRVQADGDELSLWLAYNNAFFDDKKMLERCLSLSQQLLSGNIQYTQELDFSLPSETKTEVLLAETTPIHLPELPLLVHQQIDLQAARTPQALAVICGEQQLSYQQLQQRSNALANKLIAEGLQKGDHLAICLHRSVDLIIGLLASIKSGACYIPLDPAYPQERLQYIVDDAEVKYVLTEDEFTKYFEQNETHVINTAQFNYEQGDMQTPRVDISLQDKLYMVYTSGSTGQPKGAIVYHQGEVNLLAWYQQRFEFSNEDKNLIISAVGFDLTQKNFFALLCVGGSLVLPSFKDFDIDKITQLIHSHQITQMNCAPSAFYALVELAQQRQLADEKATAFDALLSLRKIFFGGEPIQLSRLQALIEQPDYQADVINMYGPTECTDISSYFELDKQQAELLLSQSNDITVPLGAANSGVKLYVLNEQLQRVPHGLVGELCIAGPSVGGGYWKKPELTQTSFVNNPFASDDSDTILYKTGDLVRLQNYQDSEQLYYVGRKDFQVKIRGLRIELGEIEQQLKALDAVQDALVLVEDEQLLAFVLTQQSNIEDWQAILAQQLPDYMLPRQLICVKFWPLTPNGKVDRKALLLSERPAQSNVVDFVAPRTDLEQDLASLWQEVLGVNEMGVHANFFEAGGDSLSAVRLIARIELRFEVKLPVASLFGAQTIAQLAHVIDNQISDWSPMVPIQPQGSKTPIFAVHALGAMVLSYEPLARRLGKDQPFYGIQAYGFEDEQTPFTDMAEMVSFYVQAIQQQQPKGPYQLLGHSFGGLIALEIARALIDAGEQVTYLGLVDTHKPMKYVNMPLDDAFILKTFAEHNFGVVDIPLNALRVMPSDTMIEKVAQRFEGVVSETFIRRAIAVIRGFQRMTMNYAPQKIAIPIHLYRPQTNEKGIQSNLKKWVLGKNAQNLGWHKVTDDLTVVTVDGDHFSLLKVDQVDSIAAEIEGHISHKHIEG